MPAPVVLFTNGVPVVLNIGCRYDEPEPPGTGPDALKVSVERSTVDGTMNVCTRYPAIESPVHAAPAGGVMVNAVLVPPLVSGWPAVTEPGGTLMSTEPALVAASTVTLGADAMAAAATTAMSEAVRPATRSRCRREMTMFIVVPSLRDREEFER